MRKLRKLKKGEIIRIDDFQWIKSPFRKGEELEREIISNSILCNYIHGMPFKKGKFRVKTGILLNCPNHYYRLRK